MTFTYPPKMIAINQTEYDRLLQVDCDYKTLQKELDMLREQSRWRDVEKEQPEEYCDIGGPEYMVKIDRNDWRVMPALFIPEKTYDPFYESGDYSEAENDIKYGGGEVFEYDEEYETYFLTAGWKTWCPLDEEWKCVEDVTHFRPRIKRT